MRGLVIAFVVQIQQRQVFSHGRLYIKIVYQASLIAEVASNQILNIINVHQTRPAISLNQDSLLQENAQLQNDWL